MNEVTLIGSTGLTGKTILSFLINRGIKVFCPTKQESSLIETRPHDHIIYCAGEARCTSEYADNLVAANAGLLSKIIHRQNFNHLTYFSSTRVYGEAKNTNENSTIYFDTNDPRASFNAAKLLGESLCKLSKKSTLVVRPSNIYGSSTDSKLFLPTIVRNALTDGVVKMYVTPEYSKDYIHVDDLTHCLISLLDKKSEGIFNIASGVNTTAHLIANILQSHTACDVQWIAGCKEEKFSPIDTTKLKIHGDKYKMINFEDGFSEMIKKFKLSSQTRS